MVGVPGSSPVAPTLDLANDVGDERNNDPKCTECDGDDLKCIASEKLIGVERIFATYFVESCVNFCKLDCDPGSHL